MKILYHHRTRSTDAQRIHILEIANALRQIGNQVEIVSLVPTDAKQNDAARDAGEAAWKRLARRVPFAYELIQLAYNLVGIPMLLARVLWERADFIYERYSLFNFTGVLVARLCHVPLVLEVNSPFALEQHRDRDIQAPRFAAWTERIICNLASRVIVVSTPLARMLEAAGVRTSKMVVMPNGVSPERFCPQPASPELRHTLGVNGRKVIGFVGWFRGWHRLDLLIEAFALSGLARREAVLMLIGDGPALPEIQAVVDKYNLGDSVLFTGPLPHASVPAYLDLIDVAVQPAANEYCCPMKILEYMALGKPILAPRQENIQELLAEREECWFFTPGDAVSMAEGLKSLVRDGNLATRLGQQARQAITRRAYLWTANAKRVVELVMS